MKRVIVVVCVVGFGLMCLRTAKRAAPPRKDSATVPVRPNAVRLPLPVGEGWGEGARAYSAPIFRRQTIDTGPIVVPEDKDELRAWSRERPDQALAWLPGAAAGEGRDAVVEMVCARIAENDPAEAILLAERYPCASGNLLENLVHQWAEHYGADAKNYAMAKPAGPERDRLLSRVALAEARTNPSDAADLVAGFISPGHIQAEAAISVAHQWALLDPNAALAWVTSFGDENLRARAINEVAAAAKTAP